MDFERYVEGGRPAWTWFQELLGVMPPSDYIDKFTVKCTWMQQTFTHLPEGADEETVWRYARAYIMMLLSTQLFDDKSGTRMHIRWLSYVARLEDMGSYSWGSAALSWLYRCLCHVANKNVVKLEGPLQLLQSWIFWRFLGFRPDGFDSFHWPLASRWLGYQPTSSKKGPRVAHYRLQIDLFCPHHISTKRFSVLFLTYSVRLLEIKHYVGCHCFFSSSGCRIARRTSCR
ncbi:hypothetical protein Ahy_A10g051352 [Arachis hypogaea]|uniref:Aminotransferase-like plant mobile domain-containing protein n=1 Tax=Arachis hypogaea TaxID=3818 RepID=A0A445BCL9_ARAHY|nr:hypothetical protein Ahy_A10g051352 [Arachis hypogaea]